MLFLQQTSTCNSEAVTKYDCDKGQSIEGDRLRIWGLESWHVKIFPVVRYIKDFVNYSIMSE